MMSKAWRMPGERENVCLENAWIPGECTSGGAGSMTKFRKLGGKAGLTDEIFPSSKNWNYIHAMVLSFLYHRPGNEDIPFKGIYAKTTQETCIALFFQNVYKNR